MPVSNERRRELYALNKEKYRVLNHANYEKHKEEYKAKQRQYNATHKTEISIRNKGYSEKHKEEIKVYQKEYRENHREENKQYQKKYKIDNHDKIRLLNKSYREKHKEELGRYKIDRQAFWGKAGRKVAYAIKKGELVRKPCEECGEKKSQAHHCDYNKPLEVVWLRQKCHAKWHEKNKPIYIGESE